MLEQKALDLISEVFHCNTSDIHDIQPMKKGMTNESYSFVVNNQKYIIRIPGKGTENLVDRTMEYNVYQQLASYNITDPVQYISPITAYKITKYIDDAHNCDPQNWEEVEQAIKYLKHFHSLKLTVDHDFDLYREIEQYESLLGDAGSEYTDFAENKAKMYELKSFIDQEKCPYYLAHIDSVYDNFLFAHGKVYMIDWEYAGMQDQDVDLAMFANYAGYDRAGLDKIIDIYFDGQCDKKRRIKIYCYMALSGFLWGIWSEYKRICGTNFDEYCKQQYQYAKDFYAIVQAELKLL